MPTHEVFLSHASADHARAVRIRDVLVAHRIRVWFSPHHMRGADEWQHEIGRALARCSWFVVLLTPSAVKSMWVGRELSYALNQERYRNRILPLLFKKCDFLALSWVLPQIFHKGLPAGLRGLTTALGQTAECLRLEGAEPVAH